MKIGFTCGVFDLFHPGHVMMLKECKENCNYLIVALNKGDNISKEINPGKNAPIYSLQERKILVESCKYVDEIIDYSTEEELELILRTKKIDIRFIGDDYIGKKITGESLNIQIYFIDRSHGYSTTKLINEIIIKRSKKNKK